MELVTAVIDIGSNSVRYALIDSLLRVNAKRLHSTVLADGLSKTGQLSEGAMSRTADAVCGFVLDAKKANADRILIFATEAVRAAKNGAQFAEMLKNKCGVVVDVISGTVEARIGFSGACLGITNTAAVIDIGGASVEIICGESGNITYEKSLPLGMVRLIDLLGSDRQKIHDYIAQKAHDYGRVERKGMLLGIGGTATSIGAMNLNLSVYDPNQVHGSFVSIADLCNLENAVYSSKNLLSDFPILTPNRARIIGHGIITMYELLKYLGADGFTVSENDNMEGYAALKKSYEYV